MKNILVSGYIGFNNFGDEAIFYVLSSHLKSLGYNIAALCTNEKEVSKKYGVETYNYKNPIQILKAILKTDILISGGGSLLQNKTSNFSLFYYLFIILLSKICFKKVVIFSQGIEPIIGKFPQFITKTILKLTDSISLRDEKSKELLKSWNIDSTLTSDPVYSLVQNKVAEEDKQGLIVQLRKSAGINQNFLNALAFSIAKNYKGEIGVFSLQDEFDEKICLDFIKILKENGLDAKYIPNKTIDETIDIFNSTKYVICARLHGLIISSALKCRCFAISYDEKIKTLVEELGINFVDIYNYKSEELEEKLEKFFKENDNETKQYRKFKWEFIDNSLKGCFNNTGEENGIIKTKI